MKQLVTLVSMQLRDKIDLSWIHDKKLRIRNIVLGVTKFIVISILIFLLLKFSSSPPSVIFYYSESPIVMTLVLTLSLVLSVISCTSGLMKNLYFSEDNKVLITFPVNANKIFLSKLVVYFVYEVKRAFSFLIPISFSCVLYMFTKRCVSFYALLYMWIPLLFVIALPVLLGALLSIPAMYIYRLLKKLPVLEALIAIFTLIALIILVVKAIDLIPENIDLMNQWPAIAKHIRKFLLLIDENLKICGGLISTIIGEKQPSLSYSLELVSILKLLILIATDFVLLVLTYYLSRPLFFKMMAKNFEINKNATQKKRNVKRNKYLTFIHKEFIINLRTIDISVNYLVVYIIVPISIFLLNKLYQAMDTRELGNLLIYTFNVLLICLPLLSSNALVATYYSREGRTGYMKKSKPIFAAYPLIAKLFFNMLFSIPSVFVSVYAFGILNNISKTNMLIFALAILILHYAHMLWSAMLDIMNPQNEQYATTGEEVDNPNETKSTALAFVISIAYSLFAYKLLSESNLYTNGLTQGFLKLFIISCLLFIGISVLFIKRVKAYYYDMQGR